MFNDMKYAHLVIPTTSHFKIAFWPAQKTYGSWRKIVDYHKLNQVVTPIAATTLDMISSLE